MNRYIEKQKRKDIQNKITQNANRHINLGLFVYFAIFAYLVFTILNFSLAKKTNYILAEQSSIIESAVFNGLVIKKEEIIKSSHNGSVKLFASEGKKVPANSLIACVDNNNELDKIVSDQMASEKAKQKNKTLISKQDDMYLKEKIKKYILNKDKRSFEFVYDLKNQLAISAASSANTIILQDNQLLNTIISKSSLKDFAYYTSKSGVVSYFIDGMEDITIDSFKPADLTRIPVYNEASESTVIQKNNPLYKLTDNYRWYLAAKIDQVTEQQLEGKTNISIKLTEKNVQMSGTIYKIFKEEGYTYLVLEFTKYAEEMLNIRNAEFSIIFSNTEGIKIPKAAIIEKEFVKLPAASLFPSSQGPQIKVYNPSSKTGGKDEEAIVKINIYKKEGDYIYIPTSSDLNIGTKINYELEGNQIIDYMIAESKKIEGVFVINKGYAAFRIIEPIGFTTDYVIIKDNTPYGVKVFDRIASEAKLYKENQLIY